MNETRQLFAGDAPTEGIEIQMPGGLQISGEIRRQLRIESISGHALLAYIESLIRTSNLSVPVSRFLGEVLEMDGQSVGYAVAEAMCVGDRRYAMLRIGGLLSGDHVWLHPQCPRCEQLFDIGVSRSELPVKQAGDGFPFAKIALGGNNLRLRVPTGQDQARSLNCDEDARLNLARSCVVSVSGNDSPDEYVLSLSAEDIEAIEGVLDDLAPDVGTRIATVCPNCNNDQLVEMSPYELGLDRDDLFEEIHTLAIHYHWSEPDVLSLSHDHRLRYIDLINRDRGTVS